MKLIKTTHTLQKIVRPPRIKVGQHVGYSINGHYLAAIVIEDRGYLGTRSQQVVRLSVEDVFSPTGSFEVEVPVEWIEATR